MTLPPLRGYNGFDAPHDDWAGVGVLGETADQLKLFIRAVATHLEINPVAGTADMGVAQPVAGRGVVAFVRVVEPHAGAQKQDPRAEIAAEQELVGQCRLRAAADFSTADLAERFIEFLGVRRGARRELAIEDPRWPTWIDPSDGNLMEEVEQIGGIGRIWATPPEFSDCTAKIVGQREQPGTGFPPLCGAQDALLVFPLVPPDVAAGHFFVDTMLAGGNHLREERQRLAFEALLASESRAFA